MNGDLTIHGITKKINAQATIKVAGGKINAVSTFTVLMSDYNIAIPGVVADKISKEAKVEVKCNYEKKN